MKTALAMTLLLLALSRVVAQTQTNNYQVRVWTTAGGGGTVTGGLYRLSCTPGQPLAGQASGSNYTLNAGFWAVAVQTPGAPLLRLANAAGVVVLSWDKNFGDFILDQTPAFGPGPLLWSPVGLAYQTNVTSIYVTVPARNGKQFFRLRKF
jgi:hypothetical protein